MPGTIKGIGTAYYGQADLRPDGSFVTTEFISILYLPVWPLASFRVVHAPGHDVHNLVMHSTAYLILEKRPLAWMQILGLYAFLALAAGWLYVMFPKTRPGGGLVPKPADGPALLLGVGLLVLVLLAPLLALFGLRKLAYFFRPRLPGDNS